MLPRRLIYRVWGECSRGWRSKLIEQVTAGAAWLDENYPGWERKIDLGSLDLRSCSNCVCGQSLRDLAETLNYANGYYYAFKSRGFQWAVDHGFAVSIRDGWDELERLWVELIKERFATGNLSDAEEE